MINKEIQESCRRFTIRRLIYLLVPTDLYILWTTDAGKVL